MFAATNRTDDRTTPQTEKAVGGKTDPQGNKHREEVGWTLQERSRNGIE
jgi:hypothetical protein